jgi:hypothetical protein
MLTPTLAAKLLRQILVDFNSFPGSLVESPLKVSRAKNFDEKTILSRDASLRKAAIAVFGYKAPVERKVITKTLDEILVPLVITSGNACEAQFAVVKSNGASISTLAPLIEEVEFLVQLYDAFKELANPKVLFVVDGNETTTDPYTSLFITGETEGETVFVSTLLKDS